MCIPKNPKRRELNSRNYCIDFNQILLNDKSQQVYTSWIAHRERNLLRTISLLSKLAEWAGKERDKFTVIIGHSDRRTENSQTAIDKQNHK